MTAASRTPILHAQDACNLTRLNAEAANFHLFIHTAQVFDVPIRQPSGQIPGTVQTSFGTYGFGTNSARQLRTVEITSGHAVPADVQFARDSDPTADPPVRYMLYCY